MLTVVPKRSTYASVIALARVMAVLVDLQSVADATAQAARVHTSRSAKARQIRC